jgi:hypothetical protein
MTELTDYFKPDELEWRVGPMTRDKAKGSALAYLTARAVMDRLDDAVGQNNWQDKYVAGPSGGVLCELSIRMDGEWITKSDGADNTEVEPVKGGISDALKRAAVKFGIGRYLYDFPPQWIDLDEYKHFARDPKVPAWALPKGSTDKKPFLSPPEPIPGAETVKLPPFHEEPTAWLQAFHEERTAAALGSADIAKVIGKPATNNNVIEWVCALVDSDPDNFPMQDVAAKHLLKRAADLVASKDAVPF